MLKPLLVFAMSLACTPALSETFIEWNYDKQASARGKGCSHENVAFIAAGNEISVIFSNMQINLQADNPRRNLRIECKLRIPARIARGRFVTELHEQLVYGYVRQEGTGGEILLSSRFERENSGKIQTPIPTPGYDPLTEPYIVREVLTRWHKHPSWCQGREFKTELVSDIVISAHRKESSSSIVISTDGFDTRYDLHASEGVCD